MRDLQDPKICSFSHEMLKIVLEGASSLRQSQLPRICLLLKLSLATPLVASHGIRGYLFCLWGCCLGVLNSIFAWEEHNLTIVNAPNMVCLCYVMLCYMVICKLPLTGGYSEALYREMLALKTLAEKKRDQCGQDKHYKALTVWLKFTCL